MKVIVKENKKKRLVIEIQGESHTLCNAIKDELWNDEDVDIAAYRIAHPLTAHPEMIIETKSGEPMKALNDAIKRLSKQNDAFRKKFASIV